MDNFRITGSYDVIVVGGGPAGMAAALSARDNGASRVLLLERNNELGGVLNQCIHNGFGLHHFKEDLTGPEYAERYIRQMGKPGVDILTGAMALDITADRIVNAIHPEKGYMALQARAVLLAMGCRERSRGALGIPGSRPAGVLTAGTAQRYINIEGYQIGRRVVILGSGDIGLIMARRLTLEGASVEGVYEVMPHSSGLNRNIVQCLHDFDIPLHLSHTVIDVRGDKRVEQVVICQVDEDRKPVAGTERIVDCDTLLLSVGLIPENELSRGAGIEIDPRTGGPLLFENLETSVPGIFACGNVAHVHDLVDFVSEESIRAGKAAACFCSGQPASREVVVPISCGEGITYTVPQQIRPRLVEKSLQLFFRVDQVYINARLALMADAIPLFSFSRTHMSPGEMQSCDVPKNVFSAIKDSVRLELVVRRDCL